VSAAGTQTTPRVWLQEPHGFSASYHGDAASVKSLASGQAAPLSLATADFDEDGMADLAVGYGTAQGGLLVVHRGNLDAVAPQSLDSWKAIAAGQFPSAFLSSATVLALPDNPDFLAAGRFATLHTDLVAAARNSNLIDVLAGNGHGKFDPTQTIALSSKVTALASGEFGRHSEFSHVLVGVSGVKQSFLMLYTGSAKGLVLQARFALPAPPAAIALGDVDGDALPDATILAGGQVFVLHSLSPDGEPTLEPLNLPVEGSAIALGRFVFDRDPRLQIALLASDGSVHVAAHSGFNSRFWTADELKTMQASRTTPKTPQTQASLTEGWTIAESMAGVAPFSKGSHTPLLLTLRNSGYGQDDIVALNGESGQMTMISHPNSKVGDMSFTAAELSVRPYTEGIPVAGTSMRVNADGRKGVVMLHQGQIGPSVMEPLPDPTFVVNTTADTVDANPGDGKCADAQGNCSLRAAVMETNALKGVDTIAVPAGTFTLTIPPNGLGNASGGHLDITDGINIVGASTSTTIIQAGTSASNGIDKVFSINPNGSLASFDTLLSNITVQFGSNATDQFGGAFDWDAGTNGTGNITLTSVNLNSNSIRAANSDGGGALFSNIIGGTTGTVTITNSTIQNNVATDAGGGIWVGSTVPLSISNTQIFNNQAVGSGAQTGGGIALFGPTGASASTIKSSTISANQAGAQGGGIYTTEGLSIQQGTLITSNKSSGDGGGVWSNVTNDTTSLSAVTITSNTATGHGGGIQVDSSTVGNNLTMTASRLTGNSAGTGSGLNNAAGSVTAKDNWWGCATTNGPSAAPCDLVAGTVAFSPWITMTHTASPGSITSGASTTLTASFLQDSNGGAIAPGNLGAVIGVPITFGNPINGTLSNAQTTIQSTGTATATFTATAGPTASATATVDQATLPVSIGVGAFTITLSPATQNVLVGTSASYTVTVAPVNGFSGTVTLSVGGCPANTTCTLSSTSIANASGTPTLTVATTTSTPTATTPITLTVTGTSGVSSASGSATLNPQDFSMKVSPTQQTVSAGGSIASTASVTRINQFAGTVTLSLSGLPVGAAATFTTNPITGRGSSTSMTISTSTTTPTGNYTVTLTGSSGGQSRSTTFTLSVTNFTVSVSAPTSVTVNPGGTATYSVVVAPVNGFTGSVTLSVSGLPAGATGTFNPNPVNITSGSVTSTLTVTTSSTTPAANSTLTITGTGPNNLINSTSATLVVQDFSITPPSLACIKASQSVSGTVTLTGLNGFTGPASLSISGLPANATASFNPTSITINGTATSTLTIATTAATPGGNYTITITVTSNGVTHSVTFVLCVENFTISISPTSQTINAGATTSYTVTVTPVNGYTGTVNLSQSGIPTGTGATPTFSPASLTFTSTSGQQTSTLQVATTSAFPGNNYTFTVSGTDANLATLVQSVTASLNVKNFTLAISPSTQSIVAGTGTNYTLTVTPVNGYTGTLNCSVTGLPAGVTFNCPSVTISGPNPVNVTLGITVPASVGPTSSVFTVTYADSNGGNPTQSVKATLITQDFAITISPVSQPQNLNTPATYTVAISPINGFTGTVNIVCTIAPSGPTFTTPCPNSLTITNSNAVSASFTVLATQANSSGQNYTITANGTSASVTSLSHSNAATLVAQDFALALSPGTQNVVVNGNVNYTVTATSVNGFSGVVNLSGSTTLSGAIITLNPTAISVPANGSGSATMTVSTSGTTAAGSFTVTVTGTGGGITHTANSNGTVTDSRSLAIIGSVSPSITGTGGTATFTATVNGVSETVTYCDPASSGIPACKLPNGTLIIDAGTVMQALVNAFNTDSGSPVHASLTNAGLTLTGKNPGVVLTVTSSDNGAGPNFSNFGFLGIPTVSTLNTSVLSITGSAGPNVPSGSSSTFTVNVNGFTKSVTYCAPGTILPACKLPDGTLVADGGTVEKALVNAFNSDSGSPVNASVGGGLLTLTSKTPGTLLLVGSSDDGAGNSVPAIGIFGIQILPTPNTAIFTIIGTVPPSVTGGATGTFTTTVNGVSETVTYCDPASSGVPSCKLPNGTRIIDPGTVMQALVNAFNSDSASPVNASLSNAGVTLTAKTPGTVLTITSTDNNAGGSLGNFGFIEFPVAP